MQRSADKIKQLGIKVVTGDQADNATLARWLAETGGDFDVIIVSSQGVSLHSLHKVPPIAQT